MPLLPAVPSPFAWTLLLLAGIASSSAGAVLGFSIPRHEIWVTLILVAGLLLVAAWSHRVWDKPAIAEPCAMFAFWVAMLAILMPGSYFAAAINLPLVDRELAQWDSALGFDWRWFQGLFAADARAAGASAWIYQHAIMQPFLAIVILAANRDVPRLNVYFSSLLIATVAMLVLSALVPAAGAYPYYGLTDADKGHILDFVFVPSYLKDFVAVRAGTLRHLGLDLDGIVQFPSYHTIVALSAGWATWRLRWIGPANVVATCAILVTTLPIGGHHLMDLVGGGAIFAASVWLAARAERHTANAGVATGEQTLQPGFVWTRTPSTIGFFR